jgi:hypothetical protein
MYLVHVITIHNCTLLDIGLVNRYIYVTSMPHLFISLFVPSPDTGPRVSCQCVSHLRDCECKFVSYLPYGSCMHGSIDNRLLRNAWRQVAGLLAPRGFSCRPCRSRGHRLARVVRRGGRCGGHFFSGGVPSLHVTALFTRATSPYFLAQRVRRRRSSPPRVVLSTSRGSFLCLIC